jgi:hypothetical protein
VVGESLFSVHASNSSGAILVLILMSSPNSWMSLSCEVWRLRSCSCEYFPPAVIQAVSLSTVPDGSARYMFVASIFFFNLHADELGF